MKKFILFILIGCMPNWLNISYATSNYVRGYMKKDGTYVQGHYKTSPNSTKFDNYSTKGNLNPYTGKSGTVDPYKQNYNSNYNNKNYSKDYYGW